ncbi:MAG: C40 family peptidase [Candidatus Adiutrix sp.]|jgi:LysM repeat protein|nr:C40 family peptidase [Candidatus Adiutrix sp.]
MIAINDAGARHVRLFLILPILLIFMAAGCQSAKSASLRPQPRLAQPSQNKVNKVMQTAFSQVGRLYRYGGASPETGFDCSGFVKWVYGQYNVNLPRQSGSMLTVGKPVARDELRPGDLVFFGKKRVSHVGIYTGDDKYIHSPSTGKRIQESDMDDRGRGERYMAGRRIINNDGVSAIDDQLKQAWVSLSRKQFAETAAAVTAKSNQTHKIAGGKKGGLVAGSAKKLTGKKNSASDSRKSLQTASAAVKAVGLKTASSAPPKTVKSSARIKSGQHKVKAGDTLYDLSKKYGVSAEALARANNLAGKQKSNLKLGQTLIVPRRAN